ncbi:YciE [Salmonella enterica subsp. enterica serovar Braenderup]|nr:YciE [Salmonella enterica subsp. enterica serovar Braenderup]
MNYTEHYHDWLRDAHAMEKQAESMLESMASRIENYPDIKARIEQHISETKHQLPCSKKCWTVMAFPVRC